MNQKKFKKMKKTNQDSYLITVVKKFQNQIFISFTKIFKLGFLPLKFLKPYFFNIRSPELPAQYVHGDFYNNNNNNNNNNNDRR